LNKYNKFKEEENNIENNSLTKKLYSQLEKKEEEVNKLNYINKKLNEKIQNKSTSVKNNKIFFGNNEDDKTNNNKNIINTEIEHDNIVDKVINYYENRELDYKNEISKLKIEKKKTEDFQSNVKNIKGISFNGKSSFLDFDDTEGDMINYLGNKNILKKSEKNNDDDILNDIPGNESDYDAVKGLKNLTNYLKNENREKDKKYNNLVEKIKKLIQSLKSDDDLKPQISQILELIG
jgi:hypothetical protein